MSKMEVVWIQNLKGLIEHGIFRDDEEWKKIFIEELDKVNDCEQAKQSAVMSDYIDNVAYRFWSIHPSELDDWEKSAPKMPERYKGGIRAWFFACEIRRLLNGEQE